jgi:signal transduction histidine kinase
LTIDDQGIGMPKVLLDKVFEPFVTTRDLIGSGMGLWIVKRIIEEHAGVVQINSSVDPRCHGTRVSIFLPFDSPFSYRMAS